MQLCNLTIYYMAQSHCASQLMARILTHTGPWCYYIIVLATCAMILATCSSNNGIEVYPKTTITVL